MSLELVRELIKINQTVAEETTQTVFENDIIVPDIKPDVARIIQMDGDASVTGTQAVQDKIMVSGVIRFKILYATEDAEVPLKSINTNANFSYGIDANGMKQGMKCRAKCEIEHIDYEILNGRKINVRTIMKIDGKGTDEIERDVVLDLKEIEDVQVLKSSTNINMYLGDNREICNINETLEVPAGKPSIRELLRSDLKFTGKDLKVSKNKVIAKGELCISTLYIGDDEGRSVQTMEHEIPFTQLVDLPGCDEDANCNVDFSVSDARFEVTEDSDGEMRIVNGEIDLDVQVEGYSKRKIDLLDDAYSPKVRLNLEKEAFKIEELVLENKDQVVLKDNILLRGEKPEAQEVFNILSKPVLTECRVLDDKVLVEGIVKNNILYLSNSSTEQVSSIEHESAFKQTIDLRGIKKEMGCNVELETEHCSYSILSSAEIEIRIVIGIVTKIKNQIVCPIIHKVTESPIDEKRFEEQPSITIYFSQQGDNLWRIAKKYYTTVDELQKMNDLSDRDLLNPGQQIIIHKRIV